MVSLTIHMQHKDDHSAGLVFASIYMTCPSAPLVIAGRAAEVVYVIVRLDADRACGRQLTAALAAGQFVLCRLAAIGRYLAIA